jgi:opacity protein-like surface antigen
VEAIIVPVRLSNHRRRRRVAAALALIVTAAAMLPAAVTAQPAAAPSPGWDVAGVVGASAAHYPDPPDSTGYVDNWVNTRLIGVVAGRHFTPHLKAELDWSLTSDGYRYLTRTATVPGYPYPIPYSTEQRHRMSRLDASLVWQFHDNQWVHPFVQVGAALSSDRAITRTWPQAVYVGGSRPENRVVISDGGVSDPSTTTDVSVLLGGGAKVYVLPRFFIRTDGRATVGRTGQALQLRAGFGVDF